MKDLFVVFYNKNSGKELCAYSVEGTFEGETQETIELLAYENNVDTADIETKIELR